MGCLCSTVEMNFLRSLSYLKDDASFANTSYNKNMVGEVINTVMGPKLMVYEF